MKLLALVSVMALTAASAAFAQSAPPQANENPNNCSMSSPNCVQDPGGGSNKTPRNTEGTGANAAKQQSEIPAPAPAPGSDIKAGTACPPGQSACAHEPKSQRGDDSGSASRGAPGNGQ